MRNAIYLITEVGISVLLSGEHFVISTDHPNFDRIKEVLESDDHSELKGLVDVSASVRSWIKDFYDLSLAGGALVMDGVPFGEEISNKVFDMIDAGNDASPLVNFLRKVRSNPSNVAQKELLLFCVANGFMIHEDGDVIAYKSVRDDFTDIHSGKIYNGVGSIVSMDRGDVDDERSHTCSHGLHFAAFEYASTWAGTRGRHLMVMKINPQNVVSIPSDYHNEKGRCCRYEVIAEVTNWKPLPNKEVYLDSDFEDDDPSEDITCFVCGGYIDDTEDCDLCPHCGAVDF